MIRPSEYKPREPEDFIGTARRRCIELKRKIDLLRGTNGFFKGMFYGEAGVGKTELALALAEYATGNPLAVEQYSGRAVTVDMVKDWDCRSAGSLFSPWTARVIDEWDTLSKDAQALFLTTLDRRRPRMLYIVTTNKLLDEFPTREQTRMQVYKFSPVPTFELCEWLTQKWGAQPFEAHRIAEANAGCVRGALLDWETEMDRRMEVAA